MLDNLANSAALSSGVCLACVHWVGMDSQAASAQPEMSELFAFFDARCLEPMSRQAEPNISRMVVADWLKTMNSDNQSTQFFKDDRGYELMIVRHQSGIVECVVSTDVGAADAYPTIRPTLQSRMDELQYQKVSFCDVPPTIDFHAKYEGILDEERPLTLGVTASNINRTSGSSTFYLSSTWRNYPVPRKDNCDAL